MGLRRGETMGLGRHRRWPSKWIAADRRGGGWRYVSICAAASCLVLLAFASGSSAALDRVASGSLTMTSDAGDYVGGGQSYSFDVPSDVFRAGSDATNGSVSVRETSPEF